MESTKTIPAPTSSLGNLLKGGTAAVQMEVMKAAAVHGTVLGAVPQEDDVRLQGGDVKNWTNARELPGTIGPEGSLGRGDDAFDRQYKRRVTVIRVLKAAVDGQQRYEVVDKEGNAWKQKEQNLRKK